MQVSAQLLPRIQGTYSWASNKREGGLNNQRDWVGEVFKRFFCISGADHGVQSLNCVPASYKIGVSHGKVAQCRPLKSWAKWPRRPYYSRPKSIVANLFWSASNYQLRLSGIHLSSLCFCLCIWRNIKMLFAKKIDKENVIFCTNIKILAIYFETSVIFSETNWRLAWSKNYFHLYFH